MSLVNVACSDDPAPASMATLVRGVAGDFRRILVPLVLFEVAFKGLIYPVWLFGTVWLLPALVATAGRGAVTNKEIAAFMLSPPGLLVGLVAGVATIWLFLFEHLGVMFIAAMSGQGLAFRVGRVSQTLTAAAVRVLRIGLVGLAALVVTTAPFVLLAAIIYISFFTHHDINFYLSERPPSFFVGFGIAILLLAGPSWWPSLSTCAGCSRCRSCSSKVSPARRRWERAGGGAGGRSGGSPRSSSVGRSSGSAFRGPVRCVPRVLGPGPGCRR